MAITEMNDASARRKPGLFARLSGDRRGSTAAMMTAAFVPVALTIGLGVDVGRHYVVKSQLQTAVDAAALAAAQSCRTSGTGTNLTADATSANPQADAYFNDNFPTGYMGTTDRLLTKNEMCTGAQFMKVRLTGKAKMAFSFGKIAGMTPVEITATATAESTSAEGSTTIETVLVLDVTGSMTAALDSTTRIASLKLAAKDYVDVLYNGQETRTGIAIGIVPYNVTANLGSWGTTRIGSSVQAMDGYTNETSVAYKWAGCVADDQTVTTLSSDLNTQDAGAWDIRKDVAGFGGSAAPLLRPYLSYPRWIKKSLAATGRASPTSDYYKEADLANTAGVGPSFQDGRWKWAAAGNALNETMANKPAYRQYFYDTFVGLNNGSGTNAADDVIVRVNGSYYDPAVNGADWKVRMRNGTTDLIPGFADNNQYDIATEYKTTALTAKSPNQQCPAPIKLVAYGNTKSSYNTWIDNNIVAHRPGSGTIHHVGMLWGYRTLMNTAAFTRSNPTIKPAKRVMVFMTDGNFEFGDWSTNATYRAQWADGQMGFYGTLDQRQITNGTSNADTAKANSSLRFAKICQAAKNEGAIVYVVALAISDTSSDSMFQTCAPGDKYKKAASAADLREAFSDIAREVVDLHISA